MKVSLMNERVTFQKNAVVTDSIGNHINGWEDEYSCFATIGGEGSGGEKEEAGTVIESSEITVTVRYCRKAAGISSITHRLIFQGGIYDITSVDHMNFKKKCLKFRCRKVRR